MIALQHSPLFLFQGTLTFFSVGAPAVFSALSFLFFRFSLVNFRSEKFASLPENGKESVRPPPPVPPLLTPAVFLAR